MRSQMEWAKKDKSEGVGNNDFEVKVVNFSNLWALWLDYSKVHTTLNWQERLLRWQSGCNHIKILGTFKFWMHLNPLGEQARYIKFESRENLKKDTAKTRADNLDWEDNPDSKNGCNLSAVVLLE